MVYDFIYEYTKGHDVRLEGISGNVDELKRFSNMYTVHTSCFSDYREMLNIVQPQLVLVFPNDELRQFEIAKACLLADASVLCERPVCHNIAEGEELVELQKATGRFILPRYNRRYMPAYISAKHVIDSGGLGKIYMYNAGFHAGAYSSENAFILNHISHHLDIARMLLGEINIRHVLRTAEDDKRVGYNIVINSNNGTIGNIQSNSFLCGDYPMERVELSGNTCQLIIENIRTLKYNRPVKRLESGAVDFMADGGSHILNMNFAQLNNFTYYGFENMIKVFFECDAADKKPTHDMEEALKTFRLIEEFNCILKSTKVP